MKKYDFSFSVTVLDPYMGKILNFFLVFSQFLNSQSLETEKMTLFSQFSQFSQLTSF